MSRDKLIVSLFTALVIVVGCIAMILVYSDFFKAEEVVVDAEGVSVVPGANAGINMSNSVLYSVSSSGESVVSGVVPLLQKRDFHKYYVVGENGVFVTGTGEMYNMPSNDNMMAGEAFIFVQDGVAMVWRKDPQNMKRLARSAQGLYYY